MTVDIGAFLIPEENATSCGLVRQADSSPNYRQYLRGKDINRFEISPLEDRFLKYGPWLAEPRPAADFDAPNKILVRQTGDEIIAALDSEQFLCLNNVHVLAPLAGVGNLHGLLTILNSKLMTWCFRVMNPEAGEALAEVKKEFVELLPIPDPTMIANLSKIGEKIMELKTSRQSSIRSRQIDMYVLKADAAVFKLFGVTEAEKKIIEAFASAKELASEQR